MPPPMQCPPEQELLDLAEGLPAARSPALLEHMESCARCGELVAELLRGDEPREPPQTGLAVGERIGRYEIRARLGEGGMGVVYEGLDTELHRKVAIKVVRPQSAAAMGPEGNARILREARALARLSHPNVVAVLDVGVEGERVFVAMEYVAGETIAAWLARAPRTRAEVLGVFRQAGEGLDAAHRVGVAHRDFKPDNALVGADGRVRLIDFGLSRGLVEPAPLEARAPPPPAAPEGAPLTRTGTVLGTPAYMAPEQFAGQPADARADQFSFCVSLYEALYRERPFAGRSLEELRRVLASGAPPVFPRGARGPAWLQRALVRGLSIDPASRYPSMRALLDELARDRTRPLKLAAAAVVLLGLPALAFSAARTPRDSLCGGAELRLAGLWPAQRSAVRQALLATHAPYAAQVAATVEQGLDRYARDWAAMHRSACEAASIRHEQSPALLDRRMACLEERRTELKAQLELLAHPDAELASHAASAVSKLSAIDDCAALDQLTSQPPLPADPQQRAKIAALTEQLARIKALADNWQIEPGLALAEPAAAAAQALGYRPLEARLLFQLAWLQGKRPSSPEVEKTLRAAELAATAAGDESTLLDTRLELLFRLSDDSQRAAEAQALADSVLALGERQPQRREDVDYVVATHQLARGELEPARLRYQRALEAAQRRGPGNELKQSRILKALGDAEVAQARYDDAAADYRRSLALVEGAEGASHPEMALGLTALAFALAQQGKLDEAIPLHQRALAIQEAIFGSEHQQVSSVLHNLANALEQAGRLEEAEAAAKRALAIEEKQHLDDDRLATLENLASIHLAQGKSEMALAEHRDVLAQRERTLGPQSADVGLSLYNIGHVLEVRHRHAEALAAATRARAIFEAALGPAHLYTADALALMGKAQLGLHAVAAAIASLEPALARGEAGHADPADLADMRLSLAQALQARGAAPQRTRELAQAARSFYEHAPASEARESLRAADALLHPRGR